MHWVLAVITILVLAAVRWFVRVANGAKGYHREPLPRSVDDYRGVRQTGQ